MKTSNASIVAAVAMTLGITLAITLAGIANAAELSYEQRKDVVYGEADGLGLVMDIFTPRGQANGLGVVDVVSGAWHSNRGKIRDHTLAQVYQILCEKGFTVFAIRPGSITKYSAPEMIAHLNEGIRWVKGNAKEYAVDPNRLGMIGASAGGHLACLAAVTTAEDVHSGKSGDGDESNTRVKAVAVLFPPTDFLDYGGKRIDAKADDDLGRILKRLAFPMGLNGETDEQVEQNVVAISPARLVTPSAPPFLFIHGDADPLVPLQQSETMIAALKEAGVSAELIVKPGGGHPWLTLPIEVKKLADWLESKLKE
ncbi:MAG: alpha/beta hydrolase [Pirellulaceae bacterium]